MLTTTQLAEFARDALTDAPAQAQAALSAIYQAVQCDNTEPLDAFALLYLHAGQS